MSARMTPGGWVKPGDWIEPGNGASIAHRDVISRAAKSSAVLLGESHDRADNHRWQMHVCAGIFAHRRNIVLGFEMFPKRLNSVLAEWVAGGLDEASFLTRVEWTTVWNFDPDLYLPIFRFCRDNAIEMIGLNCRRGLISEVGKLGWDAIDDDAREGITPGRAATQQYRQYLFDITGGARPDRKAQTADDANFDRFVRAQQTWDRAFACRISERANAPDAPLVIGIIGRGHLEYRGGTPYQLDDLHMPGSTVLLPMDQDSAHFLDQADALCAMPPST